MRISSSKKCNEIQSLKEWHELHPIGHGWSQEILGTCLESSGELMIDYSPAKKVPIQVGNYK